MSLSRNSITKPSYIVKEGSSRSGEVKISHFPFSYDLLPKRYASQDFPRIEIQELLQKLAKEENLCRVRAVAPNAPDIHIIDIELELQPETELLTEAWDKIQDFVIESEWKLRDDTGEKWFLNAEVLEAFPKVTNGAEVLAEYSINHSNLLITSFSEPKIQTKEYSNFKKLKVLKND